jgi:hypothetical protein
MIRLAAKCSPRLSKRGLKKNDPFVSGIKGGIPRVDFEQRPAEGEKPMLWRYRENHGAFNTDSALSALACC